MSDTPTKSEPGGPSGLAVAKKRVSEQFVSPAERIAKLRAQYSSGTYNVDPLQVSAKIIDRHLRLFEDTKS